MVIESNTRLFFIAITRHIQRVMTLDHLLNVLLAVAIVMCTHVVSTVYLVYQSPHRLFASTPTFVTATKLVRCAKSMLPLIHWGKIETCLQNSVVYSVRNGRIPYMDRVPTAFVASYYDNSSIFVTSKYHSIDIDSQALVMIHECAHIALGAHDIAYVWQNEFQILTEKEHLGNADSYSYKVWEKCGNPYADIYSYSAK